MAFSGAVKLGDLNDFIAPSQACVVNLAPKPKLDAVDLQVPAACVIVILASEIQRECSPLQLDTSGHCSAGRHGAVAANPEGSPRVSANTAIWRRCQSQFARLFSLQRLCDFSRDSTPRAPKHRRAAVSSPIRQDCHCINITTVPVLLRSASSAVTF